MKTTFGSFGSASICARSSRSAAMHSMPQPVSLLAQALLAEARNADDALARRRALGEPRQRRADLAADAENDEVAGELRQIGDQRRRRRGHHVFEVIDVAEAVRAARHRGVAAVGIGVLVQRLARRTSRGYK